MSAAEIRLYLNRSRQDLQAAESNLQQGFYGVTVTRACYAMFYAANALLVSQNIYRAKHSGVISAFGEYFVKVGLVETEYAKMLAHAFDSRLDSDYDLTFVADKSLAADLYADAQRFISRVEQYFQMMGTLSP